jgi:hypothetical protein
MAGDEANECACGTARHQNRNHGNTQDEPIPMAAFAHDWVDSAQEQ